MNTQNKTELNKIRENIITMFGVDKMPEEKREEVINQIGKLIFQGVLIRVLPLLEEQDLKEYEKLVSMETTPDELMGFFIEKVPSFLEIVNDEVANFKKGAHEALSQLK